ncbi:MAG: hypothetical protein DVS81_06015 [Candidatus Accumulibacter meliphilus]|uniref:Uncharacterized protein n=1 Tax=Candidatus Accumulibacter meliphilus TaxID=2211374 RepID=A0A369XRL9_9PROT|nr:MAG: hypothetical protein DVS81_06015 [Candidatus Accumulibacter meliphilus]
MRPRSTREKRVPYSQLPFRGLVIRPGSHTCAAVRQLAGTRFLAKEVPRLPLNACDGAACQCSYSHFDDRREKDRRGTAALPQGVMDALVNIERRVDRDRRKAVECA